MKKSLMILGSVLIMLALMIFVVLHTGYEQRNNLAAQTEAFESMTTAMEYVTTNYLVGEQRVCESWANYINAHSMTGEEAVEFVRSSLTSPSVMGHILYTDGAELQGLSASAGSDKGEPYHIRYSNTDLFPGGTEAFFSGENSVYVTRAYTNPVNGIQSIAFCRKITLKDGKTDETLNAVLMRVIPVSVFAQEWVFPTDTYRDASIALMNTEGDYVIQGSSFKNNNFFEFYDGCNETHPDTRARLKAEMAGAPGSMEMYNSRQEKCLLAHTRVHSTENWILAAMIPISSLGHTRMDWAMIGIITAGLLILLAFNLVMLMRYNRNMKMAADEAERANRAKTDFLSTMSHDIRTPMNAIIGLTAIADKNVQDPAATRESLHKIRLASSHLLTLINDILDISKVESGKLNLSPVSFSIVECTENLVNISRPMVKEKNIDFNFRVNRFEHEYLYADQLRLNQIFINLLSNAIKYTQPGGRVCVDLKETQGSTEKSAVLTYTVADTGIGMTPEFMEKMYQPFSRQTDSRVNSIQGTGLGLAITKQMIDLMGGTITCESEVGKGTTFTVMLELPIASRAEEEMRLPPTRVLIADDDEVLLETAKDALESIGAQPDTARNGAEAVEMAAEGAYEVVILDWKMPDMDGIEAARRLRARIGEHVPILLISAYDWFDFEEAAKEAGISGVVSKPLFRSTLYDKISELMGRKAERADEETEENEFEGMNILVAEDNDVNWEVISTLLEMQGIRCERAENGQIAVERMEKAGEDEFQLIFMDIQMPVMNGLEATRAIRALKDPEKAGIPIIAMTADAFSENVAECLAAGMNGHIAKPIDMKLVMKEIGRIREAGK